MATLDSSGSAAPRPPIPFGQGIRPFFDRPTHINPPPGWPYIILPAEAGYTASKPVAEAKIERPRLASNVVCMWPEARPKVENMRWRGKYPSVVTRVENWIRDRGRVHRRKLGRGAARCSRPDGARHRAGPRAREPGWAIAHPDVTGAAHEHGKTIPRPASHPADCVRAR